MNKIYILVYLIFIATAGRGQQNTERYVHLLSTPDTVTAGTPQQIKLFIVIDTTVLSKNTNLKIIFPKEFSQFAFDNNPPPFPWFPTLQHGYCLVKGNKPSLRSTITSIRPTRDEFQGTYPFSEYHHDDNEAMMTIRLDTAFNSGDTLIITYGYGTVDNYVNIPNYSFTSVFKVMVDYNHTNTYTLQSPFSRITSKSKKADGLQLVLSSTAKKGKPALLQAIITDNNISLYPFFTGSFQLTCTDASAAFPPVINFRAVDSGHVELPVTFNNNGVYNFHATLITGNVPLTNISPSNPVNVSGDTMKVFWGEFHTHTEYSRDGTGDHAFAFAKNGACLDFFAQTDHADGNGEAGIDIVEWNDILANVRRYNQPGRFVTFPGYEESMDGPSGHYNVIYNAPDSLLALVPNMSNQVYNTIQKIWTGLQSMDPRISAITIPHHTGKIFSIFPFPVCSSCNTVGGAYANNQFKPLLEIYSGHGLSEAYNPAHPLSYENINATAKSGNGAYYAQDAWAVRERLGIIASSDNHLSRASQLQTGAFAVFADTLERNNVFSHLKKRHTYATTGERILLKFSVDEHLMGEEFTLACDQFPKIKFEINGTDTLQYIELLKWDFVNGRYTTDAHPVFEVLKKFSAGSVFNFKDSVVDGSLVDSSLYYIRVKQKNKVDGREVWAWSSPVWVNKTACLAAPLDTILFFDAADSSTYRKPDIKLSWQVAHQVNAASYTVQKSYDNIHFSDYRHVALLGKIGDTVSYSAHDTLPDNTVLYYRVLLHTYYDSILISKSDSVRIPYVKDSILAFSATLGQDGIYTNWKGQEFLVSGYNLMRSALHGTLAPVNSQSPSFSGPSHIYTYKDPVPLKDSSLYRIVMQFPDGSFLYSKTDTIYFMMDSVIDFYTRLEGDSVLISWKGVHEYNTEYYEIQKGQDRHQLNTIETVYALQKLFDTTLYIRYDLNPLPGMNYYEVKQTIRNDFVHYTQLDSQRIIATSITHNLANPLSIKVVSSFSREGASDLTVLTTSDKPVKGRFLIADVAGILHYDESVSIPAGAGNFIFPTSHLPSNVYFLLFVKDDGITKNTFYILDEH
jgi:hypothetical protein